MLALSIYDRSDILKRGTLSAEIGDCMMPDGSGSRL